MAENPQRPQARAIPIHVVVIPATSATARPDPIALLMGGPGEDAFSAGSYFADLLAPLLADRDLLLVDQRGTGRSNRFLDRGGVRGIEKSVCAATPPLPFKTQ